MYLLLQNWLKPGNLLQQLLFVLNLTSKLHGEDTKVHKGVCLFFCAFCATFVPFVT